MLALSLACGYVPGASLRTALPVVRRTGAHHVQLQLGEETRDVEEMVFYPAPPPDARSLLVPTDASTVTLESSVVVLPHPKKVTSGGGDGGAAGHGGAGWGMGSGSEGWGWVKGGVSQSSWVQNGQATLNPSDSPCPSWVQGEGGR